MEYDEVCKTVKSAYKRYDYDLDLKKQYTNKKDKFRIMEKIANKLLDRYYFKTIHGKK